MVADPPARNSSPTGQNPPMAALLALARLRLSGLSAASRRGSVLLVCFLAETVAQGKGFPVVRSSLHGLLRFTRLSASFLHSCRIRPAMTNYRYTVLVRFDSICLRGIRLRIPRASSQLKVHFRMILTYQKVKFNLAAMISTSFGNLKVILI